MTVAGHLAHAAAQDESFGDEYAYSRHPATRDEPRKKAPTWSET